MKFSVVLICSSLIAIVFLTSSPVLYMVRLAWLHTIYLSIQRQESSACLISFLFSFVSSCSFTLLVWFFGSSNTPCLFSQSLSYHFSVVSLCLPSVVLSLSCLFLDGRDSVLCLFLFFWLVLRMMVCRVLYVWYLLIDLFTATSLART